MFFENLQKRPGQLGLIATPTFFRNFHETSLSSYLKHFVFLSLKRGTDLICSRLVSTISQPKI